MPYSKICKDPVRNKLQTWMQIQSSFMSTEITVQAEVYSFELKIRRKKK